MDKFEFDFLCEIADDMLIGSDGDELDRIALPSLHVVNAHPSSSLIKSFASSYTCDCLSARIRFIVKNLRDYLYSTISPKKSYLTNEKLGCVDVVFVSHLIQKELFFNKEDFYFGDLPEFLSQANLRAAIVYRNIARINPQSLLKNWVKKSYIQIVPAKTLSLFREIGLRYRLSQILGHIKNHVKGRNYPRRSQSEFMANRIIELTDSYASIDELRFCDQMTEILTVTKPKILVVTFEGHAWERAIIGAAKKINSAITCIGYQHTALNGSEHGIGRSLGGNFDPEIILTTGEGVLKALLEKMKFTPSGGIKVYGTYRSLANVLQGEIGVELHQSQCLVIPDGTYEECEFIISFVNRIARLNPKISFVIRFHPLFTYAQLVKRCPSFKNLESNIRLSTSSLANDIKSCQWVLYRGSSAVIPAVISGLRPLYLKKENSIDIDPLFKMEGNWKKIIVNDADAKIIFSDRGMVLMQELKLNQRLAQIYCKSYFEKPRINELLITLRALVDNANK